MVKMLMPHLRQCPVTRTVRCVLCTRVLPAARRPFEVPRSPVRHFGPSSWQGGLARFRDHSSGFSKKFYAGLFGWNFATISRWMDYAVAMQAASSRWYRAAANPQGEERPSAWLPSSPCATSTPP